MSEEGSATTAGDELPEVDSAAEAAAIKRATKQPNGLKKMLHSKNRPGLYVIGAGALLAGGVLLYIHLSASTAAKEASASAGRSPGTVRFQAGGTANSAYAHLFQQHQKNVQEQALNSGQSSAPGFVNQQQDTSVMGNAAQSALATSATTSTLTAPASEKTVIIETTAPTSSAVVNQEAEMKKYQLVEMKTLMGKWSTQGPVAVNYAPPPATSTASTSQGSAPSSAAGKASVAPSTPSTPSEPPAVGAGNLFYSVADTSMDSYQPGPVLATLENGPLKGARLLGKFADTHNRLIIVFNTATMPNNATVAIDAIAVDPNTNRTALATSVDHHYLERYGLLIGGAFLQGFGQAVMTSGQTTIGGYGGVSSSISPRSLAQNAEASLGQVGQTVGQIGTQEFNSIQPTVRVAMGTGMGILFMKPVKASTLTNALAGQSSSQQVAVSAPTQTPPPTATPSPTPKLAPPPAVQNPYNGGQAGYPPAP